jgi:hypothetical protein
MEASIHVRAGYLVAVPVASRMFGSIERFIVRQ